MKQTELIGYVSESMCSPGSVHKWNLIFLHLGSYCRQQTCRDRRPWSLLWSLGHEQSSYRGCSPHWILFDSVPWARWIFVFFDCYNIVWFIHISQDYNNARVLNFKDVPNYVSNYVSIQEIGRMPWHDVIIHDIHCIFTFIHEHLQRYIWHLLDLLFWISFSISLNGGIWSNIAR